ncbi:unnamed protein product, partial [Ectocarpus sp. 8 AP-2014]
DKGFPVTRVRTSTFECHVRQGRVQVSLPSALLDDFCEWCRAFTKKLLLLWFALSTTRKTWMGRRGLQPKRISIARWIWICIQAASPHHVQARRPIPPLPQQGAPHINPNPLTAVTSTNSRRTNPRRPLLMTRASPGSTAQIEGDCRHGEYGHTSPAVWQKNKLAYASKADQ